MLSEMHPTLRKCLNLYLLRVLIDTNERTDRKASTLAVVECTMQFPHYRYVDSWRQKKTV